MEKSRNANRKKKIFAIVVSFVIVVSIGGVALWNSKNSMSSMAVENTDTSDKEIISTTVQKGSISDTIVGTGNLTTSTTQDIDILSDLTFSEVLVESGDTVSVGDVLAVVDKLSLMESISDIQDDIANIDAQIVDLQSDDDDDDDDDETNTIKSSISGRVKKIYAKEDAEISETMIEYGSLMLISLDGKMAVDIESDELSVGDTVKVILSDGSTSKIGTVQKVSNGTATITLTDNGTEYQESVTVKDTDGNSLGTGSLYIHQPIDVVGNYGTVSEIEVSENDTIEVDDVLITLTDNSSNIEYDKLIEERSVLNQKLQALLKVSETYKIVSEYDGVIASVNISSNDSSSGNSSNVSTGSNSVSVAYGAKEEETSTVSDSSIEVLTSSNDDGTILITDCILTLNLDDLNFESTEYFDTSYTIDDNSITVVYTAKEGYYFDDNTNVELSTDLAEITDIQSTSDTLTYVIDLESQETTQTTEETTSVTEATTTVTETESQSSTEQSIDEYTSIEDSSIQRDYATLDLGSSSTENSTVQAQSQQTSQIQSSDTNTSNLSSSDDSTSSTSNIDTQNDTSSSNYTSSENSSISTMTAFTINTNETMDISISVDELDILSVSEGQSAEITIDALEDETFQGTVTEISDTASSSGGVASYTVTISIPKNNSMKSGMNATATITISQKDDILTIPINALQEEGNRTFVYTQQDEDGNLSGEVEVETGLSTDDLVEITSGLNENDTVYYYKSDSSTSFSFGGDMSNFGGGDMPSGGGGDMPSGGGGGQGQGGFPNMN
ncbi:MAG: HlyD family efflux transporter periplasmic adaptor subunit [Ruminococcus sp.]|nr:HlyD family efflux transporter periplasmic adaptor subunit [Ruminococcus sp.]